MGLSIELCIMVFSMHLSIELCVMECIRERPFDFQGGGGFGQAGIFFLHVFRDRFFFSAP